MGRKKKGYQQSLAEGEESNKAKTASAKHALVRDAKAQLPPVTLSTFDVNYLKMIVDTNKSEDGSVNEMINSLIESKSLVKLREDVQALNQKSQGGSSFSEGAVANFACFLFLGSQFTQIKKYTQAILLHLDEKIVLNTLENIIIEYGCSDEFEETSANVHQIFGLMRTFEYKIMAYFEMHHRLIEQNPLKEDFPDQADAPKYNVQPDFIKVVQNKICYVLSKQRAQYLQEKGFVMNHNSTKSLVEFLHAYLNFINRFPEEINVADHKDGIAFVSEALQNSMANRDILTQCSIIFWMLFRLSPMIKKVEDPFEVLIRCLSVHDKDLFCLVDKDFDLASIETLKLKRGILSMAKIRGFVLTLDKEVKIDEAIWRQIGEVEDFDEKQISLANFILLNCEKNEGLQKLYSFHSLESLLSRVQSIQSTTWLTRVTRLLLKNFEYPLHSVTSCCEGIMKKLFGLCNPEQVKLITDIIKQIHSKQEIKSKFVALGLALEYLDPIAYLKENPGAIGEMIEFSTETLVVGKYVLNFFEALMRKLFSAVERKQDAWFAFWVEDYLKCLRSDDENLRIAVCTYITPIAIKISSMSLAYILSKFMEEYRLMVQDGKSNLGALSSLMTLLKVARQNKMLSISDDTQDIRLEKQIQKDLLLLESGKEESVEFRILQSDLLKLVVTQDWKMSLECFQIVTQEQKLPSQKPQGDAGKESTVSKFEYNMCSVFIKNCIKTTFPEHRINFMKAIRQFMMKLRSSLAKDIKKHVVGGEEMSADVQALVAFLKDIIEFCEANLYVDKPIESALPLFEILKIVQDLFGDFDYHIRVTQILPATGLLSKVGLLQSEELLVFLLNCLKSSWALVRVNAFDLLAHFPNDHYLLNDPKFVNGTMMATAAVFVNNPKAMIAEGAGLMYKLIFRKCLPVLDFVDASKEKRDLQLQFCRHVLDQIKTRLKTFRQTLIVEGKTTSLIHGLLSFFKNLFSDFKIRVSELSEKQFADWKQFFQDLIEQCLEISKVCSTLLSNNRLQQENVEGESSGLHVDCRGQIMNKKSAEVGEEAYGDYENLILVGVWLAVKENGQTLFNLLKWLELPTDENDSSKFLQDDEIKSLCDSLLTMLFEFKHRGAIEKAAESFSLLCNKLLCSNLAKYQQIPEDMLQEVFKRIQEENHSTILRRSAGIPPTILAILRAEPLSNQPVLLNTTLDFLLELAKTAKDSDDAKIHALNIMKFIFQDSLLKHDINKFITPAMILSTENFQSDNWSIRNSALMCFTSLTKRLLNTTFVQEQDLSRKKGLSIWEFVSRYSELSDFFKAKLKVSLTSGVKLSKSAAERQDMVIFSILLLISRLVPAFQLTDSSNLKEDGEEEEEAQASEQQIALQKTREESIYEYASLIRAYAKSGTYFVRKISAQALLPILRFENYAEEIETCLGTLLKKVQDPSIKLRQNEAHGLMIRVNIFLRAYFQYRSLNCQIRGRSAQEEQDLRTAEEQSLTKAFDAFFKSDSEKVYSPVTEGLFLKCFRFFIKSSGSLDQEYLSSLKAHFGQQLGAALSSTSKEVAQFVHLKDLTKMNLVLSAHPKIRDLEEVTGHLKSILAKTDFISENIDFTFKFLKSFYSKLKLLKDDLTAKQKQKLKEFSDFIVATPLQAVSDLNNEDFCKVVEFILKITYRINKESKDYSNSQLKTILAGLMDRFEINANLLAVYIKLEALMINAQDSSDIARVGAILKKYSYADQKEMVRVATVKSLCKVLMRVDSSEHVSSCIDIFKAIIFILNDEHPEIRSFMVQNEGARRIVDSTQFRLESESLVAGEDAEILVDLNEQLLAHSVFSKALKDAKTPAALKKVVNEFLIAGFITSNPYREHNEKNFEDKIFFYEPINKYYDLLYLKRYAFKLALQNITAVDKEALLAAKSSQVEEVSKLDRAVPDMRLSETCFELEAKLERVMKERIVSELELSTSSVMFAKSVLA